MVSEERGMDCLAIIFFPMTNSGEIGNGIIQSLDLLSELWDARRSVHLSPKEPNYRECKLMYSQQTVRPFRSWASFVFCLLSLFSLRLELIQSYMTSAQFMQVIWILLKTPSNPHWQSRVQTSPGTFHAVHSVHLLLHSVLVKKDMLMPFWCLTKVIRFAIKTMCDILNLFSS